MNKKEIIPLIRMGSLLKKSLIKLEEEKLDN
jgi:hypothetical protein